MASYSGMESDSDLEVDCSDHDSDDSHIMAAVKGRLSSSRTPLQKKTSKVHTSTQKTPRARTPQSMASSGSAKAPRSASTGGGDSQYEIARPANWRQDILAKLERVEKKQDEIIGLLHSNEHAQKNKQSKRKVDVPNSIRIAVKDGYATGVQEGKQWQTEKPAGEGRTMFLRFDSAENVDMTRSIKTTVRGLYPAVNDIVLTEAIKRYFTSTKEKTRRINTGKTTIFNERMMIYQRKKRKLENRKLALTAKSSWDEEKKSRVEKVLNVDFMSSEEEMESDGETYFSVKTVPWRSEELQEVFNDLDKKTKTLKSAKSKKQECRRVHRGVNTTKPRPNSPTEELMWALQ